MMKDSDEFYVGYLPEAPKNTSSFVKKVIAITGAIICIVGFFLALYQRKFSESTFEYGINSTVAGYYFEKPVPHLAVPLGTNADGKEVLQNVVLVGFGKSGAMNVMAGIQRNEGESLTGAKIELQGLLIYDKGKALLQVTEEDNKNIKFLRGATRASQTFDNASTHAVTGEIVDPKCYFGVMKPGEGKGHRSCAIRCIAGGIPAVLHDTSNDENFLLVNELREPLNDYVASIVGDQVTVTGKEIAWNDWKILEVNTKELMTIIANRRLTKQLISFESGMTFCADSRSMQ
jgi:hypothetical protein